jgi:hypothetical protein
MEKISNSREGMDLVFEMERELFLTGLIKEGEEGGWHTDFLEMESSLLHMSSVKNLTEGVIYACPIKLSTGDHVVRLVIVICVIDFIHLLCNVYW